MAGFEVLLHLIISPPLFLVPNVLENFKNKRLIRNENNVQNKKYVAYKVMYGLFKMIVNILFK